MRKAFSELDLLSTFPYRSDKPVLLDVGAHHGGVSKAFSLKGWKVIAFEPETQNREAFLRNIRSFPNVTCIDEAVADITGNKVPFYVSQEHYGIHSLKPFHSSHTSSYDVETIRLDDALSELNLDNVTLLKIDTEGADFLALKGFDWDRFKPEVIMAEFMDERSTTNFNYTHHDVVEFMMHRGYVGYVSEWAPVKEYGREGKHTKPHVWLRCVPYPLISEPAWGNLIFVPDTDALIFSKILSIYLGSLESSSVFSISLRRQWQGLKNTIKKIPGVMDIYQRIKNL